MKHFAFTVLLSLAPIVAAAQSSAGTDSSKRLSPSGSRVKVVPLSEMNIPASVRQDYLQKMQQEKTKGYVEVDSNRALNLFSVKRRASTEMVANKNNSEPQETHIKEKLADIQLAFKFTDLSFVNSNDIIGYAPVGRWSDGWTGLAIFFNEKNLGTCVFTLNNMALTNGAVLISAENARYDINQKPNVMHVEGNINSGFVYNINWYNDKFNKELECANMNYDKEIATKLIAYAKKIEMQTKDE